MKDYKSIRDFKAQFGAAQPNRAKRNAKNKAARKARRKNR